MNLTYSQLLRGNRNFRNLFWGQLVSELGNWFNFIAVLGLLRVVSNASAEVVGIFMVCRTLPFALLIPFAGTFVDRFSRRRIMIWTCILRFFAAFVFLFVGDSGDLWLAYGGTILLSTGAAFFDAAKNAATPNISGDAPMCSAPGSVCKLRLPRSILRARKPKRRTRSSSASSG